MMRRLTWLACLVAVLPMAVNAQITVGARGGLNLSSLRGDDVEDLDGTTGFHFGAFADFGVSDVFSVQPEILLSQKGAEESEGDATLSINLSYLEIPVLAKVRIPTAGQVGGHLLAGPAVSFETGCEVEGSGGGVTATVDCDDPEFDGGLERKSVDFGAMFGGGVSVDVGTVVVTFETRYNLGLIDINDVAEPDASAVKNGNLMFSLAVGFPIGQ